MMIPKNSAVAHESSPSAAYFLAAGCRCRRRRVGRGGGVCKFAETKRRTQMKEEAAEKKGVSLRLVDDAIKVKKEAPEELEKVRAGKKKLYEAVAELKSKQKPRASAPGRNQPCRGGGGADHNSD